MQAFEDLRKKIDDFNETCPLLELMANKAMQLRHWERIEGITGHKFDVESENFLLRNIMQAPLLQFKEDIEVLFQTSTTALCSCIYRRNTVEGLVSQCADASACFWPFAHSARGRARLGTIFEVVTF